MLRKVLVYPNELIQKYNYKVCINLINFLKIKLNNFINF